MKTADLIDRPLDWAVAKCKGTTVEIHSVAMITARRLNVLSLEEAATLPPPKPYLVIPGKGNAAFSTNWAQGGPIIEREKISLSYMNNFNAWHAEIGDECDHNAYGPTPLIASMRCFVASKLGDDVEIPKELL